MRQRSPGGIDARTAPNSNQLIQTGLSTPFIVLAAVALVLAGIALALSIVAVTNTASISRIAGDAARAAAKAETATARANTAEIYAYQVYTELNRLGYPVRTPAEDHAPQPPNNPPSEVEP